MGDRALDSPITGAAISLVAAAQVPVKVEGPWLPGSPRRRSQAAPPTSSVVVALPKALFLHHCPVLPSFEYRALVKTSAPSTLHRFVCSPVVPLTRRQYHEPSPYPPVPQERTGNPPNFPFGVPPGFIGKLIHVPQCLDNQIITVTTQHLTKQPQIHHTPTTPAKCQANNLPPSLLPSTSRRSRSARRALRPRSSRRTPPGPCRPRRPGSPATSASRATTGRTRSTRCR